MAEWAGVSESRAGSGADLHDQCGVLASSPAIRGPEDCGGTGVGRNCVRGGAGRPTAENTGIRAIQPRSYQPRTTESRHRLGYNQNLLAGRGAPTRMNEVWVGDITYIPLVARSGSGRFGYLALLMDLWSRGIVGWEYGSSMDEDLVLGSLRRAIKERQPGPGLIHHTDRGGQYAGKRYRDVLRRAGMRQSMSAAENCYDNAFMESCFGTVKTELELVEYGGAGEAVREISEYIRYYNVERRHSSLGYVSPVEFESQLAIQK
jgi:putative transposase